MSNPVQNRSRPVVCRWPLVTVLVFLTLALKASGAEKVAATNSPESAIRASADVFVKAFNDGDAKAVAAHWTAKGSLTDERGQRFQGRKAIEDEYAAFFKTHPGARMKISITSTEYPTPTTAIEDGAAQVTAPQAGRRGGQPLHGSPREGRRKMAHGQRP